MCPPPAFRLTITAICSTTDYQSQLVHPAKTTCCDSDSCYQRCLTLKALVNQATHVSGRCRRQQKPKKREATYRQNCAANHHVPTRVNRGRRGRTPGLGLGLVLGPPPQPRRTGQCCRSSRRPLRRSSRNHTIPRQTTSRAPFAASVPFKLTPSEEKGMVGALF